MDRFVLEVIAKGKVAEHLEERVVIGGHADVLDVARAEAHLASGGPREFELAHAQELCLELVHPRGGEQDRGIVARDEDVARFADASFGLKESQIAFAQLVGFHHLATVIRLWSARSRATSPSNLRTAA